jgi:AcrR family transcriptional regulator
MNGENESSVPRGRPRSATAHRAILAATLDLLREEGYRHLTIEAIAARAGVGKQTIYRWWPSKGAVILEAIYGEFVSRALWVDSGDFPADIRAQIQRMAAMFADPAIGPVVASLVGEAQHDPAFAQAYHARIVTPSREAWRTIFAQAREAGHVRADLDLDLAIDLFLAPVWYRLLLRPGTWHEFDSTAMTEAILRAITPSTTQQPADPPVPSTSAASALVTPGPNPAAPGGILIDPANQAELRPASMPAAMPAGHPTPDDANQAESLPRAK